MLRLSMNQMTTSRWSFVEDVDEYYKAGIEGIGVWRRKLVDFGEERGAELLRDSGLSVSSLSAAGGFTGDSGESFRDAIHDALEAVRLAAEIRAPSLVLISGSQNGHIHSHARRIVRHALRELVPAAVQSGVQLILRPVLCNADRRWTFLDSCQAAFEIVQDCAAGNVGLLLDIDQLSFLSGECHQPAEWLPWIKLVAVRNTTQLAALFPEQFARAGGSVTVPPAFLSGLPLKKSQSFAEIQFLGGDPHGDPDYLPMLKECSAAARCASDLIVQPKAQAAVHAAAHTL